MEALRNGGAQVPQQCDIHLADRKQMHCLHSDQILSRQLYRELSIEDRPSVPSLSRSATPTVALKLVMKRDAVDI
jgi:hypothetical protein